MKSRLAFASVVFAIAAGLAYAQQAAQVVGPVTPGNCAKFNSTTIIADAGVNCASGGGGTGTVTSVALSLSNLFLISGSPVTNNGTLTGSLFNQPGNTALMGAANGASGPPLFRSISSADIPLPTALTIGGIRTGGPTTSQYVFAVTTTGGVLLKQILANEISGVVSGAQLPIAGPSTFGVIEANAPIASNWVTGWSAGVPQTAQPTFNDIAGTINVSQLPNSGNNTVISNISGATQPAQPNSLSAVLDSALGSTAFSVIYRTTSSWTILPPGILGQFLATSGSSNPPVWATASGSGTLQSLTPATSMFMSSNPCTVSCVISVVSTANNTIFANTSGGSAPPSATSPSVVLDIFSSSQGSILYRGASIWQALAPGTSGFPLLSNGPGATPSYSQLATTNLSDVTALTSCTITDQSGASLSITTNDCHYVKIGKIVQLTFNITYPSTANGSSAKVSIPVAPTTALSGSNQSCAMQLPSTAAGTNPSGVISNAASTMQFFVQSTAALLTNANLTTLNLRISCTYISN